MMSTEYLKLRFERICSEELIRFSKVEDGIGTYSEKRLHVALKRFVCDDPQCYEVKIKGRPDTDVDDGAAAGRRGRKSVVADVLMDGVVYEIQTASMYPLKSKLEFLLNRTELSVVIVHPIIEKKWVAWIDPQSGEITKRRRSPKKETVFSIARDLYSIAPFIKSGRLKLMLPLIEVEEYKMLDGWGNGGKRGASRFERYPLSLIDVIEFNSPDDYVRNYLPESLPCEFTATEYSRSVGVRGIAPYSLLSMLCELGVIVKGEKIGRSFVYKRC